MLTPNVTECGPLTPPAEGHGGRLAGAAGVGGDGGGVGVRRAPPHERGDALLYPPALPGTVTVQYRTDSIHLHYQ
eukprot:220957-Prorocentrum_minimum.AAC.1